MIKSNLKSKSKILVQQREMANSYTGKSNKLDTMNIELSGLERELKNIIGKFI